MNIKNIAKKIGYGLALAYLVAAPVSYVKENKPVPTTHSLQLEELTINEEKRLQRPVRVKRSLELGDVILYNGPKKVHVGDNGHEVDEGSTLFMEVNFEHYGLRNRNLVFKQEIQPLDGGPVKTSRFERTYLKSGKAQFNFGFGHDLLSGDYNLKLTVEEPKSGVSAKNRKRLGVNFLLELKNFRFCDHLDYFCSSVENSFPKDKDINFAFDVRSGVRNKKVNLVSDIQIKNSSNQIIYSDHHEHNDGFHRKVARTRYKHQANVVYFDMPGEYTLELFVSDPRSNKKISHTEKFTIN